MVSGVLKVGRKTTTLHDLGSGAAKRVQKDSDRYKHIDNSKTKTKVRPE